MRVNISNHTITSIDFDNVDQVIDFIKKFNEQSYSTQINTPFIYKSIPNYTPNNPNSPWYTITCSNSENTPNNPSWPRYTVTFAENTLCSNPNK